MYCNRCGRKQVPQGQKFCPDCRYVWMTVARPSVQELSEFIREQGYLLVRRIFRIGDVWAMSFARP